MAKMLKKEGIYIKSRPESPVFTSVYIPIGQKMMKMFPMEVDATVL